MIKIISDVDEVLDFSWKLNKDYENASFPRQETLEDLKRTIEKYIDKDNHQALAYYKDKQLYGICLYFSLPANKYVQTKVILLEDRHYDAMDEFIEYILDKHKGYEFFLTGIPSSNKILNRYFLDRNIQCIESSIVTKLKNLKTQDIKYDNLNEIRSSNFKDYASFHDKYAIELEMFYTSENLKNDLDRFKIYTYLDKGIIRGSIFAKIVQKDVEIFGIFIDSDYKDKNIEDILINKLLNGLYKDFGILDEITYFLDDDNPEELDKVLENGFEIDARVRCYKI